MSEVVDSLLRGAANDAQQDGEGALRSCLHVEHYGERERVVLRLRQPFALDHFENVIRTSDSVRYQETDQTFRILRWAAQPAGEYSGMAKDRKTRRIRSDSREHPRPLPIILKHLGDDADLRRDGSRL